MGVDQTTIGKIERGEIIQPRQIHALAEVLNVSAAWLLFGVSDLERLSQDGINFAMRWQELTEDQRAVIRGMMDALKK